MGRRKYTHATPSEFVKAWQESSYVREVARKVGSTKSACSRRATRYRHMGVPLKFMWDVPSEPTNWDELADYARELAPEEPEADDDEEVTDLTKNSPAADVGAKATAESESGVEAPSKP
jgi:hypothetical protein